MCYTLYQLCSNNKEDNNNNMCQLSFSNKKDAQPTKNSMNVM